MILLKFCCFVNLRTHFNIYKYELQVLKLGSKNSNDHAEPTKVEC